MFDVSFSELLIVAAVAIIFIKPEDLPGIMRSVGRFIGKLKQVASEFSGAFDDAKNESGIEETGKELRKIIDLEGIEREAFDVSDIEKLKEGKK